MPTPQEQLIVDQVAAWLREITKEWQQSADDLRDTVVTVIDVNIEPAQPKYWVMTLDIDASIPTCTTERATARQVLADIAMALNRPLTNWRAMGAGVTQVTPGAKRIDRRQSGATVQTAVYTLEVTYCDLTPEAASVA